MRNGKINRYDYEFIHSLNKFTASWLKNANDKIHTEGIEIVTNNKDENIYTRKDKAQEKWSLEVLAQIQAIKDANTPINEGEKTEKVFVRKVSKCTEEKLDTFKKILENNDENTRLAKIANLLLDK